MIMQTKTLILRIFVLGFISFFGASFELEAHQSAKPKFHFEEESPKSSRRIYLSQFSVATGNSKRVTNLAPNDTYYSAQWGLSSISIEPAWDFTRGAGVTVAIIDSGIDYNHLDLSSNIWFNSAEIPSNGIDDDGNGYVDDYKGWDFYNSDSDPSDDNGHGTHVAGIVSAVRNNSAGIAGVAPESKVMALKVVDQDGGGFVHLVLSAIPNAIRYAANMGAKVINMSLGIPPEYFSFTQLVDLISAIDYAKNLGVTSFVAAGNDDSFIADLPAILDNVITVGSMFSSTTKSWFSNYGSQLDVMAPGSNILSLKAAGTNLAPSYDAAGRYMYLSGTSMATPMAAGVAALLYSMEQNLSFDDVYRRLQFSATDKGVAGYDTMYGYGLINPFKALSEDYYTSGVLKFKRYVSGKTEEYYETGLLKTQNDPTLGLILSYTYDALGRIATQTRTEKDHTGKIINIYEFTNYQYDASNRISAYTENRKNSQAALYKIFDYLNYQYDLSGRIAAYRRIEKDETGKTQNISDFSLFNYNGLNQKTGYRETFKNSQGVVYRIEDYANYLYDATGKIASYQKTQKDQTGQTQSIFQYSAYQYDAAGRIVGYQESFLNSQSLVFKIIEHSNYLYDAYGRISEYTQTEKTSLGDTVRSSRFSNFAYDSVGRPSAYTRTDRNDAGSVMGSVRFSDYVYDSLRRLAGYKETYRNSSGQTVSIYQYHGYYYDSVGRVAGLIRTQKDSAGTTLGSIKYANYSYDGQRRLLGYLETVRNASGTTLKTIQYSGYYYDSIGRLAGFFKNEKDSAGNFISKVKTQDIYHDSLRRKTGQKLINLTATNQTIKTATFASYLYDSKNRLISYSVTEKDAANQLLEKTNYVFYISGNLKSAHETVSGFRYEYYDEIFYIDESKGRLYKKTNPNNSYSLYVEYWPGSGQVKRIENYNLDGTFGGANEFDPTGNPVGALSLSTLQFIDSKRSIMLNNHSNAVQLLPSFSSSDEFSDPI